MIALVAREVGWGRLWDACLGFGERHTTGLKKLSRLMSHHGRGQHPCPLCDEPSEPQTSVLEHIMDVHRAELNLAGGCTPEVLINRLIALDISFFTCMALVNDLTLYIATTVLCMGDIDIQIFRYQHWLSTITGLHWWTGLVDWPKTPLR